MSARRAAMARLLRIRAAVGRRHPAFRYWPFCSVSGGGGGGFMSLSVVPFG